MRYHDTDEAEARELKAGAEVNPVSQETLKKMNDGPPMMKCLRSFPRAPESFCPSINHIYHCFFIDIDIYSKYIEKYLTVTDCIPS